MKETPQFEVFDRESEKLYVGRTAKISIDLNRRRFRFNSEALRILGIQEEMNVKFLRFGKIWFVVATTEGNGYNVAFDSNRAGASVSAMVVINSILKDYKLNGVAFSFYLSETPHEIQQHPIYELLLVPEQ